MLYIYWSISIFLIVVITESNKTRSCFSSSTCDPTCNIHEYMCCFIKIVTLYASLIKKSFQSTQKREPVISSRTPVVQVDPNKWFLVSHSKQLVFFLLFFLFSVFSCYFYCFQYYPVIFPVFSNFMFSVISCFQYNPVIFPVFRIFLLFFLFFCIFLKFFKFSVFSCYLFYFQYFSRLSTFPVCPVHQFIKQ
jgi:hypothetical protein